MVLYKKVQHIVHISITSSLYVLSCLLAHLLETATTSSPLRDCQPMRDALCVYADKERALRELPTTLSLLLSLSATRISAGSTPVIILALICISLCLTCIWQDSTKNWNINEIHEEETRKHVSRCKPHRQDWIFRGGRVQNRLFGVLHFIVVGWYGQVTINSWKVYYVPHRHHLHTLFFWYGAVSHLCAFRKPPVDGSIQLTISFGYFKLIYLSTTYVILYSLRPKISARLEIFRQISSGEK